MGAPPKPNGRPTMRDVAEAAGVSVQTVSNLVNDRAGQMTELTRARVEAAMRALDYHPDGTARGLRSARTRTLAFLVLDEHARFLADPLTDLLIAGVGDVARARDFGILIQGARPSDRGAELLRPLQERRVDGAFVLLSGEPAVRRAHVERLRELDARFVVFDELPEDGATLSVRAAEREGCRQLVEHLIASGHRRIGFVAARVPWAVVEQRHLGFRDALRAAGIRPTPSIELFEGGWEPDGGARMAHKLLTRRNPPSAIVASSDFLAIAAIHAARELGLRVPQDVAVTGFDDFPLSAYTSPALTTVAVPAYDMGRAAAELLIDELEGRDPLVRQMTFGVELRVRASA